MHLIGHSLGAHISGRAGTEVVRLGGAKVRRVTGMDPAGPNFDLPDLDWVQCLSLDPSDAQFVDAYHTDADVFGASSALGHLDVYVEGGLDQPGCGAVGACDHGRAYELFADTVRDSCVLVGRLCTAPSGLTVALDDFEAFLGRCRPATDGGANVGFAAKPSVQGVYYASSDATRRTCLRGIQDTAPAWSRYRRGHCGQPFAEGHLVRAVNFMFSQAAPFSHLPAPADDPPITIARMGSPLAICFDRDGTLDAVACCAVAASLGTSATYADCGLSATQPVYVLVHSYRDHAGRWATSMGQALLERDPAAAVLLVDWRIGASDDPQGASNTRVPAVLLARAVARLALQRVHLIGHGLGAHVCGRAGTEIALLGAPRIARITGLDPSGEHFFVASAECLRLDPTDAQVFFYESPGKFKI